MRKLILIAALVLASASARAGDTRSLTLASSDAPAQQAQGASNEASRETPKATEAPAAADTAKAETPKFVDRPAAVSTTAEARKADLPKPESAKPESAKPVAVQTSRGDRSKRRPYWTEARIIGELHRHGVYW